MSAISATAATQYLGEYCFKAIWNSVKNETRLNLPLTQLKESAQTNIVALTQTVVGLPTTAPVMVYRYDANALGFCISLVPNTWYNLAELVATSDYVPKVYDVYGNVVPLSQVWIKNVQYTTLGLLCITNDAVNKCLPDKNNSTLFITPYAYTQYDNVTPTVLSVKYSTSVATQVSNFLTHDDMYLEIFVNGVYYRKADMPTLNVGDYVDIIYDPTVYTEFLVSVDDNITGYQSTLYNGYRELLHCPKDQNPNQYIWTHDDASLFVYDETAKKGCYLHRTNAISVKQTTFNDISVDRTTLDAFKDGLKASSVSVYVKVRLPFVKNRIIRESCLTIDLYLNDDATIIQLLRGVGDKTMTFWAASVTEASGYVKLMFHNNTSDGSLSLQSFIDALGYYEVAAILSADTFAGTYNGSELLTLKPPAMRNTDITPFVYINGEKIPQSLITSRVGCNFVETLLDSSLYIPLPADVVIQLKENAAPTPIRFTPTNTAPSMSIANTDYTVYQEVIESSPVNSIVGSYTKSYRQVNPSAGSFSYQSETDGTYTLVFAQSFYNTSFIIVPNLYLFHQEISLDNAMAAYQPLVFDLSVLANDTTSVPLLGFNTAYLFINGNFLVKDVDYSLTTLVDENENAYATSLVINNRTFLKPGTTGNTLEILVTTETSVARERGYAINDILKRQESPAIWYPQIGAIYIEGEIQQQDFVDNSQWLASTTSLSNGSLFEITVTIPHVTKEVLATYTTADMDAKLIAVNTFLKRNIPADPPVIPLTQQHAVYSPFIMQVIYDLLNDVTYLNDPNKSSFVAQFTSKYKLLYANDLTLAANGVLDRTYVAVSAAYCAIPQLSTTNVMILQRLIEYTLIESGETIGDTLI